MNKPNFASVLDMPMDSIEKPKPLPAGSYICVIAGLPTFGESTKKKTKFAEFTYNVVGLGPDFEGDEEKQAAIEEMGGFQGKTIRDTYYLTPDAAYRLKEMLTNAGVETEGRTMNECIADSPNQQLLVNIKHEPSQDGTKVYANVSGTAPIE